jgi:hypothetical protein
MAVAALAEHPLPPTVTLSGTGSPPAQQLRDVYAVVRVYSSTFTRSEVDALAVELEKQLRAVDGFKGYRCQSAAGFVVSFSFFSSRAGATESHKVAERFAKNEIRNPYNQNLFLTNVVQLVCFCTSW